MIKAEYSATIDELRKAYAHFGWFRRWFFPSDITAAIAQEELPLMKPGNRTSYTSAQAGRIINAFINTHWLFKLLFGCLRAFKKSSLISNYSDHDDLSFLIDPSMVLPDDVIRNNATKKQGIGAFLDRSSLAACALVSWRFNSLFQQDVDQAKLEKLLQHVVRGEQTKAEAMLRRSPQLLIKRGNVTDYSGRTFYNVSPWECMLWALDTRYMGQMMLDCIPEGPAAQATRLQMVAQLDTMQGGGKDLVNLDAINPRTRPYDEIAALFDNEDAILFWNDTFYYANKTSASVLPIEPRIAEGDQAAFDAFKTSFEQMAPNKARKSHDAEHALIEVTLGYTLARQGIHYEREAPYKHLVRLNDDTPSPDSVEFDNIAELFDNDDAIIFWSNRFFYVNKANRSVTRIPPILPMNAENTAVFNAFKASFNDMEPNTARQASSEEHTLIKSTLINTGLVRKKLHYCDSHYDFGVIDALQTYYAICLDEILTKPQEKALWLDTAKRQREMPAHVIHHYCNPDSGFYPMPDFKAKSLTRSGRFQNWKVGREANLFTADGFLNSALGFQFGLQRGSRCEWSTSPGAGCGEVATSLEALRFDFSALRELYEARMLDTLLLRHSPRLAIEPASEGLSTSVHPS